MKKISLFFLLFSIFQIVNAQEENNKNQYLIGGSLNFTIQNNSYPLSSLGFIRTYVGYYSNANNNRYASFAFNPYFGKQLTSHLILGCRLDFRTEHNKFNLTSSLPVANQDVVERKSGQYSFGLFTRHILNPEDKFNFFLEPFLNYNIAKEKAFKNGISTSVEKINFIDVGVGAGVLYNINGRIRATLKSAGITYINGSWEEVGIDKKNYFNSIGSRIDFSSIYFGFEVKF